MHQAGLINSILAVGPEIIILIGLGCIVFIILLIVLFSLSLSIHNKRRIRTMFNNVESVLKKL